MSAFDFKLLAYGPVRCSTWDDALLLALAISELAEDRCTFPVLRERMMKVGPADEQPPSLDDLSHLLGSFVAAHVLGFDPNDPPDMAPRFTPAGRTHMRMICLLYVLKGLR